MVGIGISWGNRAGIAAAGTTCTGNAEGIFVACSSDCSDWQTKQWSIRRLDSQSIEIRHANVSSLSIMESPLIVHWDKSKTPRDRAEALPLPLYVIIAWERCLLEKGCTMLEKILLGSFLMMVWSGLRYSDLQRTIWKSISYNFAELRAICWRTKTCTKGQPYGLLASGFLSRGDHKSGTTRGCKTTRGTWTWERKSSDKRKRSDKNNTAAAILSSMAGWSSWRGCADLKKLQNCTEAEAWFCVLRTRCYNHWHSICWGHERDFDPTIDWLHVLWRLVWIML